MERGMERGMERERGMGTSRINPVIHDLRLTTTQRVRGAVLGSVLFPLRIALTALLFLLVWPFAWLAVTGLTPQQREKPLSGWRRWLLHPIIRFLSRCAFFSLGFLWIRVKGQRARPQDAPLLAVAPHSSFLDTLMVVTCDLPTVVSRSENLSLPVIGALLRFNQSLLVCRSDPSSRRQCLEQLTHRLRQQGTWPQVLIFPEGTTTNGKGLIKFKTGAFVAGVPVQPVLLHYPNTLDTVRWTWKGISWIQALWYTTSQLYTNVTVEFLPVYTPSQEEKENPNLFADNVQQLMARALGVPATEFVIEGGAPVTKLGGFSLPFQHPATETVSLLTQTHTGVSEVGAILDVLSDICQSEPERRVSAAQLGSLLRLTDTQTAQRVHSLYTQGDERLLELRRVAVSLAAVSDSWSPQRVLHCAFTLYDGGRKGWLTAQELQELLGALLGQAQLHTDVLHKHSCADTPGQLTLSDLLQLLTAHPTYQRLFTTYLRPREDAEPKKAAPLANGKSHLHKRLGLSDRALPCGARSCNKKRD